LPTPHRRFAADIELLDERLVEIVASEQSAADYTVAVALIDLPESRP